MAVESARTIDRLRHHGVLTMEEATERLGVVDDWLEAVDLVLLRPPRVEPCQRTHVHARRPLPQMVTHDAALAARGKGPRECNGSAYARRSM